MAFQQGLSGLNTSSRALDVIGNNVANSSTVGFKMSEAHFADVYAASLAGGSALQIGIGTKLTTVAQQFNQGNITTTNNTLDLAINGNGFFNVSRNGAPCYTRNGQFHVDSTGNFVNDESLNLMGYPALADGSIPDAAGAPSKLQLTPEVLKLTPVATGASKAATGVQMSVNLDSRVNVDPLKTPAPKTWSDPATLINPKTGVAYAAGDTVAIDPTAYNFSTALTTYDSLGNPHSLTFYFVKDTTVPALPATSQWSMYANVDGTMPAGGDVPDLTTPTTVTFDVNGKIVSPAAPLGMVLTVPANTGGAATPITSKLDLTGTTQYGAAFTTDRLTQDGYAAGTMAGLGVTADGIIQGRYTNGQTRNIGQVALATFQNNNGLASIGGNLWVETADSGQALRGKPGAGQFGAVQANSVEESNTDLTAELVKMITQQRNYQANAQTIKTQDSIMQTIVNLR
jgi:flagellar hook protein FlgE